MCRPVTVNASENCAVTLKSTEDCCGVGLVSVLGLATVNVISGLGEGMSRRGIAFDDYLRSLPSDERFVLGIVLGGSARPDKGFFRLGTIIQRANQLVDPRKLHFIIQGPPDELYVAHTQYVASLYAQPNVTLLASTLPYSEIVASFSRSHIALMPYDPGTYEWRGSAMLMEAIMFNRQVICQAGTAFADQARAYGAGEVCGTDADFSDAIAALSERDPKTITAFATIARTQYLSVVNQSCSAWFEKAAS